MLKKALATLRDFNLLFLFSNRSNKNFIECVRSYDQKPYLHNETKGGICIKIEFNPQKNISLLQHGRRFFAYFSNMAAVKSYEHTLLTFAIDEGESKPNLVSEIKIFELE